MSNDGWKAKISCPLCGADVTPVGDDESMFFDNDQEEFDCACGAELRIETDVKIRFFVSVENRGGIDASK